MALFIHECGKRYLRTTTAAAPPKCKLVVCEQCLEPMPVCDEKRLTYAYAGLGDYSIRRLVPPAFSVRAPGAAA